ncbi:MAG: hypothetical protein K8T25_11120 [Planctomycetia bacterium]|nr:hypothetical protein [Planctomycetia bacterium]
MIRARIGFLLALAVACQIATALCNTTWGAPAGEGAAKEAAKDAAPPAVKYRFPEIMMVTVPDWPKDPAQQDQVAQYIKKNGFNSVECQMDMLDCCRRNGIYARLGGDIGQMLAAAPKLKDDKAVFCYFISDRRRPKSFPGFANTTRAFEKADPNHPTMFINRALWNQFPAFVEQVKPNMLSYYQYQWRSEQKPERNLLYLGMFRDLAAKHDIPLVRCTDARSTAPQMRQEHYTTLAYGAKGFHYSPCYHFGVKKNDKGEPILENGQLVQSVLGYAEPLIVIAKEIRTMSPVLVKLNSVDVYHTDPMPLGGKKAPADSWVDIGGPQVLVGVFKHEDGGDYLMPVNYDATATHEATLKFKPEVTAAQRMDRTSGKWIDLAIAKDGDHGVVKLTLPAGDGELLKVVRSTGK